MSKRLVGHHGPEIRSADADIDDIADALVRVALPCAAAHSLGEIRHPVENGPDLGHDIRAVAFDGCAARRTQGHVQHCAVLRDVDLVAAEHRLHALLEPGLSGELDQQLQRLVGHAVFGVVKIESHGLDREPLAALGVLCKELPQMQIFEPLVVRLQRFPCRERAQAWYLPWLLLGPGSCACALGRGRGHLCQLALRIALALRSTQAIRSFQDLTNEAAPSSWRRVASASMSTPTLAKLASTASQSPPSTGSVAPVLP